MSQRLIQWFVQLVQSYFFLILLALGAGLLLPDSAIIFAPFATLLLQIIFFLTSLKLNPTEIFRTVRNTKMLIAANVFMLLLLPSVVYLLAQWIVPEFAIALMLLAAMPTGMTAPLLSEVVGGKTDVALVLTLTTSLLAPFTIPFVIGIFASTAVTVSGVTMFWSLVKVIVIPFVLAQGVRSFFQKHIQKMAFTFKPISLLLLGMLIAGVVAKQSHVILTNLDQTLLSLVIALFCFISLLLVAGYFVAYWRPCNDRTAVSICMTFMNFTLAIYLAGLYFSDPNVLLATVLVVFPWAIMLLPFRFVVHKYLCK
ncbi:hypothetical protein COV06_01960 [Candidatus Uhrbacteria bacterium CG10_big_fil_rev_8_21_14_0_10_50_16]|uniref:Bile acid:sodium symporter n=1 Tax=Candidatus Uhrbacteria bacterium CG10_big_fil_rev_8_21_14_0_10_50_16 TaxID=1975039 RepID=A0A2H0RMR7_9BACT|nr:MAG: hypothetical protein COV06_01960 [Candidatus Uhrbacteria bacterium CG10_big_fil_rev_8_21_14_0_10_50_16]